MYGSALKGGVTPSMFRQLVLGLALVGIFSVVHQIGGPIDAVFVVGVFLAFLAMASDEWPLTRKNVVLWLVFGILAVLALIPVLVR